MATSPAGTASLVPMDEVWKKVLARHIAAVCSIGITYQQLGELKLTVHRAHKYLQ